MIEITMPRLSDTMEEGAILSWLKKAGDRVEVGDILAEIETDKATMEYEAYEAGTLSQVLVAEGDLVSVGAPIAILDDGTGDAGDVPEAGAADAGTAAEADQARPSEDVRSAHDDAEYDATAGGEPAPSAEPGERRFASPLVRKLARENHLDLARVNGSGPGGRIIRNDIEPLLERGDAHAAASASGAGQSAAVQPASAQPAVAEQIAAAGAPSATASGASASAPVSASGPASGAAASAGAQATDEKRGSEAVALSNTRRVIARRLGESARSIPHFYVTAVADAEALVQLRTQLNEQLSASGRPKVSINDLLIRASALALREHPLVNASYQGDESTTMLVHHRINIGVAVASENGLVVPVIEDADGKSVTRLGAEAKELVGLANAKKLTPAQMSGGTFTISNLGMFGVEQFTAIINPPEGAILAVGGTAREPVVVGDEVLIRHRMRYTLSADHRIIDGALAARFLQTLTRLIENPWTIIA
jgi:pyruvate dehydrogenase E2 component (dihydrolipoamide acetyltransferase)